MAVSERDRLRLYERLGDVLGPDEAGTFMELVPPTGWDDIATKQDVQNLGVELRGEMAELRGELKGEIAELRGEFAELRGEMGAMEGRLMLQMATMQRNLFIAMAGFALTIWISLLLA